MRNEVQNLFVMFMSICVYYMSAHLFTTTNKYNNNQIANEFNDKAIKFTEEASRVLRGD